MKIIHLNPTAPVKKLKNTIIDLYSKEKLYLKHIHQFVTGDSSSKFEPFTGFTA
jgi:hypothetical protein